MNLESSHDRRGAWKPRLHDRFWKLVASRAQKPKPGVVTDPTLHAGGRLDADVCIVTNCTFPGGNAVTTLTELEAFEAAGLRVLIVNCSIKRSRWKWRWMSERFLPWQDRVVPAHHVEHLTCRTLIARGPRMMTTRLFEKLTHRITPDHAIMVINNAARNEDGRPIFDWPDVHRRVAALPWPSVELCPLSPLIRAESDRDLEGTDVTSRLSPRDWPPVLDETAFEFAPRPRLTAPITIGRHARDHPGKWLEDPDELLAAYPEGDPDLRVRILGGAEVVEMMLGRTPDGWEVLPFGLGGVQDYLASLDVFVNFPSPERHEAFGRTIAEAVLSGLPVILPPRFEATFGDLGFYCMPAEVRGVIERLAADDPGRLAHLAACRDLAAELYGRASLVRRLRDGGAVPKPRLSEERRAWRSTILPRP